MIDPLSASVAIASSGLNAQSQRVRIVSENLANSESTGKTPGANPYARKTITFGDTFDETADANLVAVTSVQRSKAPFRTEYNPSHPAADAQGNVKLPNVNILVEMADMREANRSYDANLQVVRQARDMISMTIDLLRNV
jgi:flagellar basal-body rod protein FlgC